MCAYVTSAPRETRFERSNRILAPELRGYVRRKVRHRKREGERERKEHYGREREREVRGTKQKSRKYVSTHRSNEITCCLSIFMDLSSYARPRCIYHKKEANIILNFTLIKDNIMAFVKK